MILSLSVHPSVTSLSLFSLLCADLNCVFVIPAKARDYVFTGVGLSVCLSVCLFVCLFVTAMTK